MSANTPILIRHDNSHSPPTELHLPPMILDTIFFDQLQDSIHRSITDGWASLDPVLVAAAHTCRRLRLHLLPFIYNGVHIYRLKSLTYLNQILDLDPDTDLRVAPHICKFVWNWNPCGPYSSIWGLAGAFCDRRRLRKRIAAGKYPGIHDPTIEGPLPSAARIRPAPWSYPEQPAVPPVHSDLDTGPDGDGLSSYKEPLHIVKAIGKLAEKLSGLEIIAWNAALLPPPPCLFANFSREHPLEHLIIYNEHNLGDPLQTPYYTLPPSIKLLALCIHRQPDLQIPTSTFVKARRDAQRLYLRTLNLHSHPLISKSDFDSIVAKCVPDSDVRHCALLAWPTLQSEDADKPHTTYNDLEPISPLDPFEFETDERPEQLLPTPEGVMLREVESSSEPSTIWIRLPWPWLGITHFETHPASTVTVEKCPARVLPSKLQELYCEGNLRRFNLCPQSFLHHRPSHCRGTYAGVGPTQLQRQCWSTDEGWPTQVLRNFDTPPGLCAKGKACFEHPSLFEMVELIPLWMGISLQRTACYSNHAEAAACLDDSLSQVHCSLCLARSLGTRHARRDEAWEAAHLLRPVLTDLIRQILLARATASGQLDLKLGQVIVIEPEHIKFLIQHGGWLPADGLRLEMGVRCAGEGIDLHCRATTLNDRSIQPRFGAYQGILLTHAHTRELAAAFWNQWQMDMATRHLRLRRLETLPVSPAGLLPRKFGNACLALSVSLPIEWRYRRVGVSKSITLREAVKEWGNKWQDQEALEVLRASLDGICSCTSCSKGSIDLSKPLHSNRALQRDVQSGQGGKVLAPPSQWKELLGDSKQDDSARQSAEAMTRIAGGLQGETRPTTVVATGGLGALPLKVDARQMDGEATALESRLSEEKGEEEDSDAATLVAGSEDGYDSDGSEGALKKPTLLVDASKGTAIPTSVFVSP